MHTHPSLQSLAENRSEFVAFVERRVGSRYDAEDIVSTAFVKATASIGTLRDTSDARAWFYRTLRNAIVDFYRAPQRKEQVDDTLDERATMTAEPASGCACAAPLLAELPTSYAQILEDVASSEGKGLDGASRVRLSRARSAMRQKIAKRCGTSVTRPCGDCACS